MPGEANAPPRPRVLVAELTHRCPLRCAYCSNPDQLARPEHELSAEVWRDVFVQAAELGVYQAHLSGGEPLLRADVEPILGAALDAGLYTTLVTSGLAGPPGRARERLAALAARGLRVVQLSIQDTDARAATAVCGRDAGREKLAFARLARQLGLSLTLNVVLQRENIGRIAELIELALELGADRLELAHVQYQGWARHNREALLPSAAELERADRVVAEAKLMHAAALEILYVMADHHSGRAKPCMGGWGQRALVVAPDGMVLPCHAAVALPLEHDRVPTRPLADIWARGAAFTAFRGEAWMEEPCRSCPERGQDFGGCRCQAFELTGRERAADPACQRAPEHERVVRLRRQAETHRAPPRYRLRGARALRGSGALEEA